MVPISSLMMRIFASDADAVSVATVFILNTKRLSSLCPSLFILGILFPIVIWPLLPSTSEVINYRILGLSSLMQFILALRWLRYAAATTTDTGDSLHLLFGCVWGSLISPFLCCFAALGFVGHKADKSGKRLAKESFDIPANITVGMPTTIVPFLERCLLNQSTNYSHIAGIALMGVIAWRHGAQLFRNAYYHIATRRISLLYWLPQNGSDADFDPWWSHLLRVLWASYNLGISYIVLFLI
jgi:hypothetical protein